MDLSTMNLTNPPLNPSMPAAITTFSGWESPPSPAKPAHVLIYLLGKLKYAKK